MDKTIFELATTLDQAAHSATAVKQLSSYQKVSLVDAYHIQAASIARRYTRDEKLVGYKMGFTSKAKMEQMGVHDLIWGRLTDQMFLAAAAELESSKFIHPRAEPEIAFLLSKDITTEISRDNIMDVVQSVAPAIEIIDSRYENFKFSLEDVVADNCSSAAFKLGDWKDPSLDISQLEIILEVNGEMVHSGSSNAILGDPFQSLVDAIRLVIAYGDQLYKGQIVLAGAATPAVYINKGDEVKATVDQLGMVELAVK